MFLVAKEGSSDGKGSLWNQKGSSMTSCTTFIFKSVLWTSDWLLSTGMYRYFIFWAKQKSNMTFFSKHKAFKTICHSWCKSFSVCQEHYTSCHFMLRWHRTTTGAWWIFSWLVSSWGCLMAKGTDVMPAYLGTNKLTCIRLTFSCCPLPQMAHC